MKNYEKYADEIKEYNGTHFCKDFIAQYILKSNDCTDVGCARCKMLQMLWLLEDCKEPEIDWSKVEVDTPILVRDNENNEWQRFHFAKYEDGFVYTWIAGATSWTAAGYEAGGNVYKWNFAKLAEDEKEHKETEVDWSKVNVDTPILVGEGDGDWVKRYFAEYKDGIVYAWCGGSTSWDANNMVMSWKYAKLAENEETK